MLHGVHERKLDYKGRLTIPDMLVSASGNDWHRVVVMRDFADVPAVGAEQVTLLCIYDHQTWSDILREAQLSLDDDNERRMFMHTRVGDAATVEVDSVNRLTLPKSLLQHSGIGTAVTVVGVFDHLELWNPEKYQTFVEAFESQEEVVVPSIAEVARSRIRALSETG